MGYSQQFKDAKPDVFPTAKRSSLFSSVRQKFWKDSSQITIFHLEEMYTRNGLANKVVNLYGDKAFNKWWKPDVDDDKLNKELELLSKDKKIRYKASQKEAFLWSRVFGYAIVLYGYLDGGNTLADPVKNPVSITQTSVIDKRNVKRFIYEDDLLKSGEIVGVELLGNTVGLGADIVIHRSRFDIIGDPQSRGMIFTAYNWLELFDNNTWSFGQAMFRYGSGFPFLTITDASDEEIENAEAMWATVTARTGLVGDDRHNLDFKGANGKALDFKAANEVGLQLVSIAMGMPYALVVGAHAGTVTGSETNSSELYDQIEAIQHNEVEQYQWDALNRFYEVNMISRIDFEIEWEPLWQLDSKQVAEIEFIQAQTDQIYLNLGATSKNEVRRKRTMRNVTPDADFDIDGGDEFKTAAPPTPFGGGSSDPGTSLTPPNVQEQPGQDAVIIQQKPMSKLEDNEAVEAIIKRAQTAILGLYDFKALRKAVNNFTNVAGDDNQTELLAKVELTIDSNLRNARDVVDKIIDESYTAGVTTAAAETEQTIPTSAAAAAGKSALKVQLFEIVKGLNADAKKELRNALINELQKAGGSDLASVRKVLKERVNELQIDLQSWRIPAIARTETNRAFNDANYRFYQDAGVTQVEWLAASDDVDELCDITTERTDIGTTFSNGYAKPPVHPNCRCSIIPVITPREEETV